jgi:hypothetical protein
MITCEFNGALGNNLFTLATLINHSLDNGFEFCIPSIRNCYVCDLHDNIVEIPSMFEYSYNIQDSFLPLNKYISPDCDPVNQIFNYIPFTVQDNTQIVGYFQSEKYFNKYKKELIETYFRPKTEIVQYINQKYPWINKDSCLSIHIRVGGDRPILQHSYKNVSLDYYTTAINTVLEKDPTVEQYVIFSDNIKYCTEIFGNNENITYIENEKSYIDLFLMSMCKHNIIANSTFSWWASWLNKNPSKIIVAPKSEWFGPSFKHLDIGDLLPDNWITL